MPAMSLSLSPRLRVGRSRRFDNRTTAKSPARRPRRCAEEQIHRAVCQHLEIRGAPGLVWFAVPNGGWRSPVEAAIFKGLGVKAGVADLILFHAGKFFALELKTETGRATDAQRDFVAAVIAAGGQGAIGCGLNQCLKILEGWRLLTGQAQCALPAEACADCK